MAKRLTVLDFFKKYPDEETCLYHVMEVRYGMESECPKCGRKTTFHRMKKRPAFACQFCGHHVYPMAGTPFENTRTPLQMWFYAIYLFTTTKHGVPAKELQRQLGVTYKTAWRMGHEIRKYMGKVDGNDDLSGDVEIDETYIGGRESRRGRPGKKSKKTAVLGMVERGGPIVARTVKNARKTTLIPVIKKHVAKWSHVNTDQLPTYKGLADVGYFHDSVNHALMEWTRGNIHTNNLESFWARLKLSIRGTHIHVSRKHLPKYLSEFEFRFNHRDLSSEQMLDRLMKAF